MKQFQVISSLPIKILNDRITFRMLKVEQLRKEKRSVDMLTTIPIYGTST